jgi:hypothetical protein
MATALPWVEEEGCRFGRLKGAPDPALGLPAERHIHRSSPLCCYIWAVAHRPCSLAASFRLLGSLSAPAAAAAAHHLRGPSSAAYLSCAF